MSLRGPAPTRDSSTRRRTPLPLHPRPSQKAAAGASFFALRGRLRGQLGAPAPPPTPFSQPRLNRPRLARGAPTRPRPALREARGHRETADPANRRSLPGARARTQCTYIGASPRRPFLSTQPLQPPPPCTITLLRGRAEVSFPVPTPHGLRANGSANLWQASQSATTGWSGRGGGRRRGGSWLRGTGSWTSRSRFLVSASGLTRASRVAAPDRGLSVE